MLSSMKAIYTLRILVIFKTKMKTKLV